MIKIPKRNVMKFFECYKKFKQHVKNWEKRTIYLSDLNAIVEDDDFLSIIKMGKKVTPFIINEIKKRPSPLVFALNVIYKDNSMANTIKETCILWSYRFDNNRIK